MLVCPLTHLDRCQCKKGLKFKPKSSRWCVPRAQSRLQYREGLMDAALGSLREAVELATQAFGRDAPQSYYVRAQLAIFLR